jgi:hypothetical protein
MGRITLFIAALAVAGATGCKRDRSGTPEATPKTTESAAAAEDEAEAALEVAREARATADSALETARAAQAAARATADIDDGAWWSRALVDAPAVAEPRALDQVDRISVAGRVTESGADRIVFAPVIGAPVAVRVDADTRVALDGQPRSAADLAPGTEVRLLYRLEGAQVIAERVDAHR